MSDSIFGKEPRTVFRGPEDDAVNELATIFKNNTPIETKEPDWSSKLRAAKNQREKWEIQRAKEAWQQEAQFTAHQAKADEHEATVAAVLNVPVHLRTKQYYDSLKTKGGLYFDPKIQRQMRADKQTLKLGFYLKSEG